MDTRLLHILACPLCQGKLYYDAQGAELVCRYDRLAYAVDDGVAIMDVNKARKLTAKE
jgi:uncharacterized protein